MNTILLLKLLQILSHSAKVYRRISNIFRTYSRTDSSFLDLCKLNIESIRLNSKKFYIYIYIYIDRCIIVPQHPSCYNVYNKRLLIKKKLQPIFNNVEEEIQLQISLVINVSYTSLFFFIIIIKQLL